MRLATSPQADPRGTAECRCHKVVAEEGSFVSEMLLDEWSVGYRVQLQVLIVRDHKQDIRRLGRPLRFIESKKNGLQNRLDIRSDGRALGGHDQSGGGSSSEELHGVCLRRRVAGSCFVHIMRSDIVASVGNVNVSGAIVEEVR